jgi:hypothetical protein
MKFEVKINVAAVTSAITKVASKTIREAITLIHQGLLQLFALPKTGRKYKRQGGTHQASAPGEAPAIDTGFLQNSIVPDTSNPLKGILTIGAEYAALLEEGSPGGRLLPRPFVRPAIRDALAEINKNDVIGRLI